MSKGMLVFQFVYGRRREMTWDRVTVNRLPALDFVCLGIYLSKEVSIRRGGMLDDSVQGNSF